MAAANARDRLRAAAGVAAVHVALGVALVTGFAVRIVPALQERLRTFDVAEPPPPAEESAEAASDLAAGAASAPDLRAAPSPVVAPELPARTPLPAVREPTPVPPGNATDAGNAERPGPGSGTAGTGIGTGAGGEGSGPGGGGRRAQRIGGAISGATDYPPAARRAGFEGTVRVRFVVGTDGRARDCRVTRTSGNAEIDSTTCLLIEQRFRYRPALDASGRPVPETVSRTFDWLLPGRR